MTARVYTNCHVNSFDNKMSAFAFIQCQDKTLGTVCVTITRTVKNRQKKRTVKFFCNKGYSTTPRNGNPVNGNHLDICLLSSQKNRNSLTWPGGLDSVF